MDISFKELDISEKELMLYKISRKDLPQFIGVTQKSWIFATNYRLYNASLRQLDHHIYHDEIQLFRHLKENGKVYEVIYPEGVYYSNEVFDEFIKFLHALS